MEKIAEVITGAQSTRSSNDDDFADRLNSRYTVVLLVMFAVLVSLNQYVREPITCWAPVHFTDSHTKFTTNYCWVKNTYYLPWEEEVPREHENDKRQMVPYYQWIPFILLAQAVFFFLPTIFWHGLNQRAGIDSDNILAAANALSRSTDNESRDRMLLMLTNQLERFLDSRVKRQGYRCDVHSLVSLCCCAPCGRRIGNYLVVLFLFSKLCYIANVIGQLFVLNYVLGARFSTLGFDMLGDLVSNRDWTEDSYVAFPRVTLCDFHIRGQDMANVQRYTVQCVLPINLYNEKIFMFLWFWMVLVAAVSVTSFVVWIVRAAFFGDRVRFIRNHLKLGARPGSSAVPEREIARFAGDYLRQDGAFLLRLIAHNTDNVTTTEAVCAVWNAWKDASKKKAEGRPPSETNSETLPLSRRDEQF